MERYVLTYCELFFITAQAIFMSLLARKGEWGRSSRKGTKGEWGRSSLLSLTDQRYTPFMRRYARLDAKGCGAGVSRANRREARKLGLL